jgi:hypothetical protein
VSEVNLVTVNDGSLEVEALAGVEEAVACRHDDGEAVDEVGDAWWAAAVRHGLLRRREDEVVADELAEHGEELQKTDKWETAPGGYLRFLIRDYVKIIWL